MVVGLVVGCCGRARIFLEEVAHLGVSCVRRGDFLQNSKNEAKKRGGWRVQALDSSVAANQSAARRACGEVIGVEEEAN